jgi:hypothetical protein
MLEHLHKWKTLDYNARTLRARFVCGCGASCFFYINVSISGAGEQELKLHRFYVRTGELLTRELPLITESLMIVGLYGSRWDVENRALRLFCATYDAAITCNRKITITMQIAVKPVKEI